MTIAVLAISDGRDDIHHQAWLSFCENVNVPDDTQLLFVEDPRHELGFHGAVQAGWDQVIDTGADWVFHFERDFTFNEPIDVPAMVQLLERQPHLVQVALKRQAWNPQEKAAGGIVEQHPDDYVERSDDQATWTEHRRFFTTNPSVYSARLCRLGWPQESESEGKFTHMLLRDPLLRFAFWGAKFDPPRVEHIGHIRTGVGY